jgi:hypothetical protein
MKKIIVLIFIFAVIVSGCSSAIATVEPKNVFKNEHIRTAIKLLPNWIYIGIQNISDKVVKVEWDECSYTDVVGDNSNISTQGTLYADMSRRLTKPTVIPPRSSARIYAGPSNLRHRYVKLFKHREEDWNIYILKNNDLSKKQLNMYAGRTYKVVLTYVVGDKKHSIVIVNKITKFI